MQYKYLATVDSYVYAFWLPFKNGFMFLCRFSVESWIVFVVQAADFCYLTDTYMMKCGSSIFAMCSAWDALFCSNLVLL